MTFLKKAAAIMLCGAMFLGGTLSANAEVSLVEGVSSAVTEPDGDSTTLLDVNNYPETVIIDTEGTENTKPESGVDLSDTDYVRPDISDYIKWDGKAKLREGVNYYIEGTVKPRMNFTVPKGSTLLVTAGSKLVLYKGRRMNVKGSLIIEPKANVTFSGTFTLSKEASLENYGTVAASVSSVINISSEFIIRHNANATFSGKVNVYKTGMYLNYGKTSLTKKADMTVTGEMQTPVEGRFFLSGRFAVSVSGKTTQAGYFSLSGNLVNSGVFIFESTAKYYKSKSSVFAVSKSSRLIDYRYIKPGQEPDGNATDIGSKGIDVSYAQGVINWEAVKLSGVKFAMIRSSRGPLSSTKPAAVDKMFDYNITEASKYGIEVGVYHYLYADTVEGALAEAEFFLKTIEPYKITYPVVLDVEEQYQADLGKNKLTKIVKAFLDKVQSAGYYTMLYANKAWLTEKLDMQQLSEYDVWLAQWNTVPTYKGAFGMWQYSSKGIVSGIDGYVDLNIAYKDYSKIIKKGGFNNLK